MPKSILVFLCFLFLSLTNSAQDKKHYNSLLWEITGNGMKKPSYLYGTMHVSNKVAFHLSDSFFVALKSVDVVGLETNPENWMKELYGKPVNEVEITYRSPQSTSAFYTNCFKLNIPGNRELERLLKYYPNIINSLLYRKKEGQDNFEENTYLDLFILQSGKKYGKEIASLEDYKYSQSLVDLAKESIEENEEDKISNAKKNKILKGASYSDLIEDAYRRSDLDYLDSISRIFYPSKNYHKYMLELRNEIMVNSMDSIMKHKSVFSGVGAAHLPGEKGMINYLIKKGYKVRAVILNKDLDSKQKEEVEKIHYPVNFTSYTDPDSLFTVEVPGHMYEMAKTKSYKYFLYPDMVNGCFYLIMTVQNYSALLGVKPNDYSKKLDSLLFENIPGKILKKTSFTTSNGYIGYDIENVTKRGDYQFYKIIFTPTQLIVVKVIGNGDYTKGEEAQHFIQSIKMHGQSKQFTTHYFPNCGAKIYMPQKIHQQSGSTFSYRSYTNYLVNAVDETNHQYVFMQSTLLDYKTLEEDTFELNMLSESFCKEQDIKLKSTKLLSKEKYPAISFTGKYKNTEIYGKIIAAQPNYYLLLTNAKDKNSELFFNSLQLSAPIYNSPFETFVDSTLFCKVNTIALVNKDKKYLSHYEDKKINPAKKDLEPKKTSFTRTHYFSSPSTKECVEVTAKWFSKYSNILSPDSFWVRRARMYSGYGDLVIKEKTLSTKPKWQEAYVTYTDTNTKQIINVKMILKGEMFYLLRTNSDSLHYAGKFTSEFMKTFEPTDTTIGSSIYISKASSFFNDLYSKDKPTSLGAKEALNEGSVDFFETDDTILIRNIKRPEFSGLTLGEKQFLISSLAPSKNPRIHLELKELYDKYVDSTDIQMAIIKTLAREQTSASTKTLLDILINDTPQLEDKEEAFDIFYPYYDSLTLAKELFPHIMELTRASEYKYAIHKLMAYGVYKNVFSKELFNDYKPFILKECKSELRRQFSSEKETDFSNRYFSKTIVNSKEFPAEQSIFSEANNNSMGNSHLYALYILLDLYKDDPTTKALFEKIQNIKPGYSKSIILSYLLNHGHSFKDSVLSPIAADPYSRVFWYSCLKKYDLTKFFDSKYFTQKDFAYSLAFGQMKIDPTQDTILFVDRRWVTFKNHTGYAYFYKIKQQENFNYTIHAVGVFPKDEKQMTIDEVLDINTKQILKGDSEKELIDDMVQAIRIKGRTRAKSSYSFDDY